MKKVFLTLSLVFFVLISCKKESEEIINRATNQLTFKVRVNNYSMLEFNSLRDFNEAIKYLNEGNNNKNIDALSTQLSFVSMKDFLSEEKREALGIEDDLLATVLSPNGTIQIGNYFYKVDIPNENVKRIYESDFVSDNSFDNKKIVENYSIYDKIDENGAIITDIKSSACSGTKKGPYYFHLTNGEDIKYKLVYQSSLFYHSLLAKIKRVNLSWGGNIDFGMSTSYQTDGYSYYLIDGGSPTTDIVSITFNYGGNDRKYVWRKERKLSKYKLKVFFIASNLDDNTSSTNILEIKCHDSSGGGGGGGSAIGGGSLPEVK